MVYQLSYLLPLTHVGHCLHKAHLCILSHFLAKIIPEGRENHPHFTQGEMGLKKTPKIYMWNLKKTNS